MRFLDFGGRRAYDPAMMLRAIAATAILAAGVGVAHAQSLADVARAEEARRQSVRQPSRVYTNADLRPDFTRPTPAAPASGSSFDAAADATAVEPDTPDAEGAEPGAPAQDQAYWANRMAEARTNLERSRTFAQALQNRVDALWTDFVNRDNPVERATIEQERIKALEELARVKKDIDDHTKAIADIEEDARRANVPRGWLRS